MLAGMILPDYDPICACIRSCNSRAITITDDPFETELGISVEPDPLPANVSAFLSASRTSEIFFKFKPVDIDPQLYCTPIEGEQDRNEYVQIFRGTISCITKDGNTDESPEIPGLKVVCKLAYMYEAIKSLEKEARNYTLEPLQRFQGKNVPYFYGFFTNKLLEMACIVLQDCGDPVDEFTLSSPSLEEKKHIMKAVAEVHCAGNIHNQLSESHHILLSSDPDYPGPFIVDWQKAEPGHQCPINLEKGFGRFRIGDWEPHVKLINCPELYDFTETLEAWIPVNTRFNSDIMIPSIRFRNVASLMDYLEKYEPNEIPETDHAATKLCKGEIKEFKLAYGEFLKTHNRWPKKTYGSGRSEERKDSKYNQR
ncbi:hypothetical protein QCA50_009089 [Cerrena zonata]|uniref:Protein kinase domain-containing protein n=1 Tax=Cerrena zonata TaxID=2478898 RepID=A0AAW0G2Z6_9APHY